MITGDPAAVRTAADALERAGRDLNSVGDEVGRHGREVTSQWSGAASDAAGEAIGALAACLPHGGDAGVEAAAVLHLYADALAEAQADYAYGQDQVAAGRTSQQAAANNLLRMDTAAAAMDLTAAGRLDAAEEAWREAGEQVAYGAEQMARAVQLEAAANASAAEAVLALVERVDLMHVGAPEDAAVPSTASAMTDLQAALDVLEEEPLSLQDERRRDTSAGIANGIYQMGADLAAGLAAFGPFGSALGPLAVQVAREPVRERGLDAFGVDQESYQFQRANFLTQAGGATLGGAGAVRGLGAAGRGMAAAARARSADETSDAADAAVPAAGAVDEAPVPFSAMTWSDKVAAAQDKVPDGWAPGRPNSSATGTRWFGPNPDTEGVRVDLGNPQHSWASQQVDHVIVRSDGKVLGPDGQPIVGSIKQNPQAHIPLEDWLKWKSWNTP